jgi:predicted amidohydrolase YtcJ
MATRLATILVMVIVGATFIAGLIVGAQRDDASGPVDLIIVNGKVYAGHGADIQEAVAVRGNQILRVGSNRDVKRLRRAQTVVLDAHGATVLPGLNDAHVQLMAGALALDQLDLSSATTLDDIETHIYEYAEDVSSRPWVLGRNGDAELFATADVAARKMLDEVVPDRPVLLTSADGKVAWANSKALEQAGIGRRTRGAQPGVIVKDRRTGEPTGVLKASAIDLMTRVLPQPTHAEKIAALRAAIDEAHKLGVTSVQTVSRGPANGTNPARPASPASPARNEEMDLLNEIRQQGDLSVRVYGSVAVSPDIDEAAVLELDNLRLKYPDDPKLKIGGVEVVCSCDPAKLQRAVTLLDRHNWNVMVRASDEADVHAALDAFEHATLVNPAPLHGRRYRLEDIESIDQEDLARLPRFGVIAEPSDPDVIALVSPLWSALSDAGVRLLFGSNWPADSFDPRDVIEDAVAGNTQPQAAPDTVPSPVLSVRSVIDAYTRQAAYASYDEQRKGTLAPGMLADIVILSNDIFRNSHEPLKDTEVTVTIFDGKIVYKRPAQATSN